MRKMTHLRRTATGNLQPAAGAAATASFPPLSSSEQPPAQEALPEPPPKPPIGLQQAVSRITGAVSERLGLFPAAQPAPRPASSLQSFAQAAGIAVAITGGLALFGWAVGLKQLTSISSGYVSMKPNTAFAFVLRLLRSRLLLT